MCLYFASESSVESSKLLKSRIIGEVGNGTSPVSALIWVPGPTSPVKVNQELRCNRRGLKRGSQKPLYKCPEQPPSYGVAKHFDSLQRFSGIYPFTRTLTTREAT